MRRLQDNMAQLQVMLDKLNKRSRIPAVLPDQNDINGIVYKNYVFEGAVAGSNELGTWYVDRDNNYYWGKGLAILQPAAGGSTLIQAVIPSVDFTGLDLPVNHSECLACADWMQTHFGDKCAAAVANTVFEKELLYAIACQETAIYWHQWINDHTADEILARCIFDASGDVNGTRSAFPANTADFISRYGQDLANMLIAEANATRALRGWSPKDWVYAGYGIFQYDIQAILTDEVFFTQKMWYTIDACLERLLKELSEKWNEHTGDLFNTVRAYNGSGVSAENYARNVFQFLTWIKG